MSQKVSANLKYREISSSSSKQTKVSLTKSSNRRVTWLFWLKLGHAAMHCWCGRVAWKHHVSCAYTQVRVLLCRFIVTLIIIVVVVVIVVIILILVLLILLVIDIIIGPSLSSFSSSFTSVSSSSSHRQPSGEASQDWCWMESEESSSQATKRVAGDASVPRLTRRGQTVSRFAKDL